MIGERAGAHHVGHWMPGTRGCRDCDGATGSRRLFDSQQHAHVGQALTPVGFGWLARCNTIRKVSDLAAKLIDVREGRFLDEPVLAQAHPGRSLELEAGIKLDVAGGAHNTIAVDRCGSEADDDLGDAAGRKAQGRDDGRLDLGEAWIVLGLVQGGRRLDRLFGKDVPRGVDAVDADNLQRAAPMLGLQAMIAEPGLAFC